MSMTTFEYTETVTKIDFVNMEYVWGSAPNAKAQAIFNLLISEYNIDRLVDDLYSKEKDRFRRAAFVISKYTELAEKISEL